MRFSVHTPVAARAQQADRMRRIGVLLPADANELSSRRRSGGHTRKWVAHAAAMATKAAASEATEAATATARIASTPTHRYVLTHEAAMGRLRRQRAA